MLTHCNAEAQRPDRVVLLGAGGFVSTALTTAFQTAEIPCRAVGSAEIDLTDPAAGEELAGILSPQVVLIMPAALTPDKGRDIGTLMKNLRMGEQVAAALGRAGCAHLIYVSSDAVYDWRSSLINEESSCEPVDLYAAMHITRERMLGAACQPLKIPYAVVRSCAVYGPGDTHNSYGPNRFIRTALHEGVIRLFGEGEEIRDHLYIRDLIEILKRCALYRSTGVVNAASSHAIPFRKAAELVAAEVGSKVQIVAQPRSGPVTHRHFDPTELIRSFPDFQATSPEAGIRETVARVTPVL